MVEARVGRSDVAGVPDEVLDELAQSLAEKIDILLDRLTDRALTAPAAGSAAWQSEWAHRDSTKGRAQQARRVRVRAILADKAGIATHQVPPNPTTVGQMTPATRPRTKRKLIDDAQLSMF
ncbi:hypothetical protein [Rhodococcus sp. H29-C3]|uniref:hypothetical protein n=1 Tax=Rhodococcus sp. H29-C3 TaxID=3046307 RepID=UPI0024BAD700|nr:hypothetical protein [Rhodococcus sp. H29-C3]MDJ0362236.1 hypothetical protein [Rhodococcus sp. H29-C3]